MQKPIHKVLHFISIPLAFICGAVLFLHGQDKSEDRFRLTSEFSGNAMPYLPTSYFPPLPDGVSPPSKAAKSLSGLKQAGLAEALHNIRTFEHSPTQYDRETAINSLLDYRVAKELYGGEVPFCQTRNGARYIMLSSSRVAAQAHPGHALSVLAECGIPSSHGMRLAEGKECHVEDVLNDLVAGFEIGGEVEWQSVALAAYLQKNHWDNRFGKHFTFDKLTAALMFPIRDNNACGGSHRLYALAFIRQADARKRLLSHAARAALDRFLQGVLSDLQLSQMNDGKLAGVPWNAQLTQPIRTWCDSHQPEIYDEWLHRRDSRPNSMGSMSVTEIDYVVLTGHHLEWIALLPEDWQPSLEWWHSCYRFLERELNEATAADFSTHFCPLSHALRVLQCAGATTGVRSRGKGKLTSSPSLQF